MVLGVSLRQVIQVERHLDGPQAVCDRRIVLRVAKPSAGRCRRRMGEIFFEEVVQIVIARFHAAFAAVLCAENARRNTPILFLAGRFARPLAAWLLAVERLEDWKSGCDYRKARTCNANDECSHRPQCQ